MNKYNIIFLIALLIYAALVFTTISLGKNDKLKIKTRNGKKAKRTSQSFHQNMAANFDEKANIDKKFKIETTCLQAGKNLTYGQLKVWSLVSAIISPIIILTVLKNPFLALAFSFIGYNIPYQVIKAISNKRVIMMEDQVGSFLRMVIERFKTNKDVTQSIVESLPDFKGCEPFYTELKQTVIDINVGKSSEIALASLARRTGSPYLKRFSDYYRMIESIATHESKVELLNQSFLQYEEKRKIKILLKKELSGPVRDAYIMVAATPIFMIYQCISTPDYLEYITNEPFGKFGVAVVFIVLMGACWFINSVIGKPID